MATLQYDATIGNWWTGTVSIVYSIAYDAATNKSTVTFAESTLQYTGRSGWGTSSETVLTVTAGDNTASSGTATLSTSGTTHASTTEEFKGTPNPNTVTVQHSAGAGAKTITIAGSTTIKVYAITTSSTQYTATGSGSASATPATLYTLTINAGTGSNITVKRSGTTLASGATVAGGDVLTISAASETGYDLSTLKVNGTNFSSGGSHTVTGAVTVASTATVKSFTLSISAGTGSTIAVSRTSSPKKGASTGSLSNGATVYYSDVLTVTFGASTGYDLGTHTVNGTSFTSGGSHTVTGAVTVASTATVKSFTLTISAGRGTTITVRRTSSPRQGASTGTLIAGAKIYYGDVLTVSFTANSGYLLQSHTVNNVTFTSGASHTVTGAVTAAATALAVGAYLNTGTEFGIYQLYIYGGSSWGLYRAKIYNGSAWEDY